MVTEKISSFARMIAPAKKREEKKVKPAKDQEAVAAAYNSSYTYTSSAAVSRGWQRQVAHFYGDIYDTRSTAAYGVGELRFGVNWLAQQVARLGWSVEIDGKTLPSEKSEEYVNLVADRQSTEQVAANLALFGELAYAAYPAARLPVIDGALPVDPALTTPSGPIYAGSGDMRWRVVSVVDDDRAALLEQATLYVIGIKPSPLDPVLPDAPVAGVLDALSEIEQLSALSKAQTRSRLQTVGLLGVASELSISADMPHNAPDGAVAQDTDDFAQMLQDAITRQVEDPELTGAIPILIRAPAEMLADGGWASWLQMSHSYDEVLANRLDKAIQRLAWGLPMPTEVLMGMSASNRAVAFQIEEAGYKEHVEPFALATGQVYASALSRILDLPETAVVRFIPDPTALLARQHSVEDAITAWNMGLVSSEWVRSVLGIPEEFKPTEADLALLLAIQGGSSQDQPTAANGGQRPGETSTKDGSPQTPIDGEPTEGATPSTEPVAAALAAAIQMSVTRAREKVGAKVRTAVRSDEFASGVIDGVTNLDVAAALGEQVVEAAIDVEATIFEATEGLTQWWVEYLEREDQAAHTSAEVLHSRVVAMAQERMFLPGTCFAIPAEVIDEVLSLA